MGEALASGESISPVFRCNLRFRNYSAGFLGGFRSIQRDICSMFRGEKGFATDTRCWPVKEKTEAARSIGGYRETRNASFFFLELLFEPSRS